VSALGWIFFGPDPVTSGTACKRGQSRCGRMLQKLAAIQPLKRCFLGRS
jgi:hypothetical protein